MTFYDVLCQWNKETEIVIKCRKLSWHVVNCRDVCRKLSWHFFSRPLPAVPFWFSPIQQGVSKQGVKTFAWRPGSQHVVAATRGADTVLASDCRAQFDRPSTRRGCRICVTVRLPVRPRGETVYWQANANTPLSVTPLLNVPYDNSITFQDGNGNGNFLGGS